MSLEKLNPEEDYDNTSTYYHGFGDIYNLEGILDQGGLVSNKRRSSVGYESLQCRIYEDILRHAGEQIIEAELSTESEVLTYIEENEDDFKKEGSEATIFYLDNRERLDFVFDRGVNVIDNLVWASNDRREAKNYSSTEEVLEQNAGGFIEFELPENSVLEMGLNGGVPGKIPLEFAEKIYLDEVPENAQTDIWVEFTASKYNLEINSL